MSDASRISDDTATRAEAPATATTAPTDAALEADTAPAPRDSPTALTSLSSLLGGSVEGGAACAADGTCD